MCLKMTKDDTIYSEGKKIKPNQQGLLLCIIDVTYKVSAGVKVHVN